MSNDDRKRLFSELVHATFNRSWYNDYLAISPLFSTIELLIPLGAEFNALSPHKL